MIAFDLLDPFIDRSRQTRAASELADDFARLVESVGFTEFIACSLCDFADFPKDAVLLNRYSAEWSSNYLDQNYSTIDPIFAAGQEERFPFIWQEFLKDKSLSRRQRRLFEDAHGFGHRFGMTIPIHISGSYPGCVSLTADRPFDRSARHTIHLLSVYFFEAARRLVQQKSDIAGHGRAHFLTAREAECLRWAADGKSTWEIGVILTISEATARFHLENVRRKYGAVTTTQAVASALIAEHIQL